MDGAAVARYLITNAGGAGRLRALLGARGGESSKLAGGVMSRSPGRQVQRGPDSVRSDTHRGGLWVLPAGDGVPAPATAAAQHATRIAVRSSDRVVFVRTEDIDWFEAAGNYVKLHIGAQELRIRLRLRELAAELDPSRFRQIHRSTIVNIDRVSEVQPWAGGDYIALLRDRQQLRVSRTYARALLRTLQ